MIYGICFEVVSYADRLADDYSASSISTIDFLRILVMLLFLLNFSSLNVFVLALLVYYDLRCSSSPLKVSPTLVRMAVFLRWLQS